MTASTALNIKRNHDPLSIQILGLGGAGYSIVNLLTDQLAGVKCLVADTDLKLLEKCSAGYAFDLNREPEMQIREPLAESDIVFLVAGLGGDTGSSAAPGIARICRELGILTIAVVTMPYIFEGSIRKKKADFSCERVKKYADIVIPFSNDILLSRLPDETSFGAALQKSNQMITQIVTGMIGMLGRGRMLELLKNRGLSVAGFAKSNSENALDETVASAWAQIKLYDPGFNTHDILCLIAGPVVDGIKTSDKVAVISDAIKQEANIRIEFLEDESIEGLEVLMLYAGKKDFVKKVRTKNNNVFPLSLKKELS